MTVFMGGGFKHFAWSHLTNGVTNGFKHFLEFSSLGEMIQFDERAYFLDGLVVQPQPRSLGTS